MYQLSPWLRSSDSTRQSDVRYDLHSTQRPGEDRLGGPGRHPPSREDLQGEHEEHASDSP